MKKATKKMVQRRGPDMSPSTLQVLNIFKDKKTLSIVDVFLMIKKKRKSVERQWVSKTICNLTNIKLLKRIKYATYQIATKIPKKYSDLFKVD